jgi:hypothetical protein
MDADALPVIEAFAVEPVPVVPEVLPLIVPEVDPVVVEEAVVTSEEDVVEPVD